MSKKLMDILTEAAAEAAAEMEVGGEGRPAEMDPKEKFKLLRDEVNNFIKVLRGRGVPRKDGAADLVKILELYFDLRTFAPARSLWIKLSNELGVEQKFFRIFDSSVDNNIRDEYFMKYIEAIGERLKQSDVELPQRAVSELLAAFEGFKEKLRPNLRNKADEFLPDEIKGVPSGMVSAIKNADNTKALQRLGDRFKVRV